MEPEKWPRVRPWDSGFFFPKGDWKPLEGVLGRSDRVLFRGTSWAASQKMGFIS